MMEGFTLACPACHGNLEASQPDLLHCPTCEVTYPCTDSIWRMLPADRMSAYQKFIREYEAIRQAEGRGSQDPEYYRSLPFADLSGNRNAEWTIRGRSFRALLDQVIRQSENQYGRPLKILDLGAGNAWLSNRLAQRGHHMAAIDLLVNTFDGLGAFRSYETRFLAAQAEIDHLPLADRQADLVIFNASFHYSVDYNITLRETLRVLAEGGRVVVLDTPVYRQANSGARMVQERQLQFERQYGFPSNALPSENYLTFDRVRELGELHNLAWEALVPAYGFHWAARPWIARLRRQREPARFILLIGKRK